MKNQYGYYEIASELDPGIKRRGDANQDALAVSPSKKHGDEKILLVLADGMGGHIGGSTASGIVIQQFLNQFNKWNSKIIQPIQFLSDCVQKAYQEMRSKAAKNNNYQNMGSTVVAVVLEKTTITLSNVGDSRAYLINEHEVKQVSFDHSFVGELVRQGLITPADALRHPKRNILNQSISPARAEIHPFSCELEWYLNDNLLLCSDGLWSAVSELQMQTVVCELKPENAARRLVQLANMNQGLDNISVVIARRINK